MALALPSPLAFVDAQLGRIRRYLALATTGELAHTLFIVTADHGENFLDHEEVTHGKTLYESEARVPLVVSWPGHVPAAVRDEPVSHLDVLPTVVELLGLPPHPSFQGASFLRPGAVAGRGVYLNIQGLRFADALVCWPFKLFEDRTGKRSILFHLDDNPAETLDYTPVYPELAERMRDTLAAQFAAQLAYHDEESTVREERFQPRMLGCPALP